MSLWHKKANAKKQFLLEFVLLLVIYVQMFRYIICIYWVVLFILSACVKENNVESCRNKHEYFVSGEALMHPSSMLVELQPEISETDEQQHFYLGPVHISSGCKDMRCGIYHKPLSVDCFYPVYPQNVMSVENNFQIYSVEIKHTSPDTLILDIAFSRVEEGEDGVEMTNGSMRLPFIKANGSFYRCIIDGLPLSNIPFSRNGVQRLFVDMNGLFM